MDIEVVSQSIQTLFHAFTHSLRLFPYCIDLDGQIGYDEEL